MATFERGQRVNIVGGKYQGKSGIVSNQCKVMVRIMLLDSAGKKTEVCLMPKSVTLAPLQTQGFPSNANEIVCSSSISPCNTSHKRQQSSNSSHSKNVKKHTQEFVPRFEQGQRVNIVGGKYKGESGIVSQQCKVMVRIMLLESAGNSTTGVCLMPKSVALAPLQTQGLASIDSENVCSSGINPCIASQKQQQSLHSSHVNAVLNHTQKFVVHQQIKVVAGEYQGQTGRISQVHNTVSFDIVLDKDNREVRILQSNIRDLDEITTLERLSSHSTVAANGARGQSHYVDQKNSAFASALVPPDEISTDGDERCESPSSTSNEIFFDAEDDEYFDACQQVLNNNNLGRSDSLQSLDDKSLGYSGDHVAVVSDESSSSQMSYDFCEDFETTDEVETERAQVETPLHNPYLSRTIRTGFKGYFEVDKIILHPPGKPKTHNTFAHCLFGNRILDIEVPFTGTDKSLSDGNFPIEFCFEGCHFHLLSSKVRESSFQKTKRVGLHYVAVSGKDFPSIDLQEELEKIAAFPLLSTRKAAARLELFQSPARHSNRKEREFLIFNDLKASDFETIPEEAHEGCGFIPRHFIEHFLGNCAVGKRTFALQVRVFAPQLGIFKGMLMEKPGINKIQLPESMRKVGPSLVRHPEDWACLSVTRIHPSTSNIARDNTLNGKAVPKSWNGSQCKLSPMIETLFQLLNVPQATLRAFKERTSGGHEIRHTNAVGVADPTDKLPEGHVFVTGLTEICQKQSIHQLFVTRYPCTEPSDGCLLPLVTSKPQGMTSNDWEWLNGLSFGAVIFANPRPECPPTPTTIAGGDLDGDLYFITWDREIITSVSKAEGLCKRPLPEMVKDVKQVVNTHNQWWLAEAQDQMSDLLGASQWQALIGVLYNAWHARVRKSDFGCDTLSLGRAYKQALDIGKHGGRVNLSQHLWTDIPQNFHKFF